MLCLRGQSRERGDEFIMNEAITNLMNALYCITLSGSSLKLGNASR